MSVAQQTLPPGSPDLLASSSVPDAGGSRSTRGRRRPERSARRGRLAVLGLLAPAVVMLAIVVGWPLLQLIVMSFQEYGRAQVFGAPAEFVGLQNYADTLTDPRFWEVMGRSILLCIACVVLSVGIGTLLALLLTRLNRVFKMVLSLGLLLAWAMPALSATIVWGWLFDTQYGVINYALSQLPGVDMRGHSWLQDPFSFFIVATVIIVWGAIPFIAFTVYAGLTQISEEVIEAAQLDGATAVQRFRHIIAPSMRSIFVVVIVLSVIWDLRVFTQIFALQGIGGSTRETTTIGVYIYQVALGSGEYGAGGAISMLLVALLFGAAFVYVRQTLKEEER